MAAGHASGLASTVYSNGASGAPGDGTVDGLPTVQRTH